jgi:hypothetical protein
MLWVLLAGCGGLRDGKELRDLDKEEAQELCKEYDEEQTAECTRKGYCTKVTVGGTECDIEGGGDAVLSSCDATVEDYRNCMDKLFEDPCLVMTGLPSDCNWIRDCVIPDTDDTGNAGGDPKGEPCES